jgi:ribonuclease BN (tRNA processing enzyme)
MGNGSLSSLQKYIGLFDVDAIVLSHLHADHCVDLYSYAVARAFPPGGAKPPIPVYGPAGTRERVAGLDGFGDGGGLAERYAYETLAPGRLEIGPFTVTTTHVLHPVETFAFRFEHGERSLVYSGDTGPTDVLPQLARGANVLLSEASWLDQPDLPPDLHLSARQAAQYARQAGVGRLILTHLQAWNDAGQSFHEAAATFGGGLDVAVPGQVIELKPR